MYHKFEFQLHFRLHWHLKLHFMVDESDAVLEVTQDNLNPSLSLQKLFPSTEGNSVCTSLYNFHAVSPSFIHSPFLPHINRSFSSCLEAHIKRCSVSIQRQFACFGNQPDLISQFLKHQIHVLQLRHHNHWNYMDSIHTFGLTSLQWTKASEINSTKEV